MNQQQYWDSVAGRKVFTSMLNIDLFRKYAKKEYSIIDIGCGYGRILAELYKLGFWNLYGIDSSSSMIESAKKLAIPCELKVADAVSSGYTSEKFDVVILFSLLTCLYENDKQNEVIKESWRILKPKGIIVVDDFLLNSDERNLKRYYEYYKKYNIFGVFELPEGVILRHHSLCYIIHLLHEFSSLHFEQYRKSTMNGHMSNSFLFMGQKP